MPNDEIDDVPPLLKAFGGWVDSEWFSETLLTDPDVIGFTLPRVGGVRKQGFHVVERSASGTAARKKAVVAPAPRRLGGKLAYLLDLAGATMAVACSRDRFIFESAPVLFFAELPASRLKPRAVAKLRKEVAALGVQCCVVRTAAAASTVMVWPGAEVAITAFIVAASPDYPLHVAAEPAALGRGSRGTAPPGGGSGPGARRDTAREARLLQEIAELRRQVGAGKQAQTTLGAMAQLGLSDARLKAMLKLLHPDKHGGSEDATEAAQWLNGLREILKAHSKPLGD